MLCCYIIISREAFNQSIFCCITLTIYNALFTAKLWNACAFEQLLKLRRALAWSQSERTTFERYSSWKDALMFVVYQGGIEFVDDRTQRHGVFSRSVITAPIPTRFDSTQLNSWVKSHQRRGVVITLEIWFNSTLMKTFQFLSVVAFWTFSEL